MSTVHFQSVFVRQRLRSMQRARVFMQRNSGFVPAEESR